MTVNGLCCDNRGTNHIANAWQSVRRGGPHGCGPLTVLFSLWFCKALRSRGAGSSIGLKNKVTGPRSERPDLIVVATSNPFEIAESVRQVGDAGVLRCGADLDRILHLALLHCFHKRESQHDSQAWKQIRSVGAQSRVVRAQEVVASTDLWSVQLHDALHAPCMLYCGLMTYMMACVRDTIAEEMITDTDRK